MVKDKGRTPVIAAATTTVTEPPNWLVTPPHCPYRQADRLQQALSPDKMRIAFFLGAGCGMAVQVDNGGVPRPLIPNIEGLTQNVCELLKTTTSHDNCSRTIIQRICDNGITKPTVEDIFSHVRALHEIIGSGTIDGLTKADLAALDSELCKHITAAVRQRLPGMGTPYHQLATWIGSVRRAFPIELFTSNYDLLMEQALEVRKVPYFDGFVGSDRTFFDISSMEQDSLPARWARLWKVHGSINWWRTPAGEIERRTDGDSQDRQMIYPSHLKYDQSRRMPYLAMLDRLRAFLARGQAVLITCGYSFSDQHLNDVVTQGLRGNPTAVCFALMFGDLSTAAAATFNASKVANLTVLARDGGVIGTVEQEWHAAPNNDHPMHRSAVAMSVSAPTKLQMCLGDFRAFGAFLASQLNFADAAIGGPHAE